MGVTWRTAFFWPMPWGVREMNWLTYWPCHREGFLCYEFEQLDHELFVCLEGCYQLQTSPLQTRQNVKSLSCCFAARFAQASLNIPANPEQQPCKLYHSALDTSKSPQRRGIIPIHYSHKAINPNNAKPWTEHQFSPSAFYPQTRTLSTTRALRRSPSSSTSFQHSDWTMPSYTGPPHDAHLALNIRVQELMRAQ